MSDRVIMFITMMVALSVLAISESCEKIIVHRNDYRTNAIQTIYVTNTIREQPTEPHLK